MHGKSYKNHVKKKQTNLNNQGLFFFVPQVDLEITNDMKQRMLRGIAIMTLHHGVHGGS